MLFFAAGIWLVIFPLASSSVALAQPPAGIETTAPENIGAGSIAPSSERPPSPAISNQGVGSDFAEGLGAPALALVAVSAWVVKSVMVVVLSWAGQFLDFAFQANIDINPAQMPVVQIGWRVMRDLANGLFILIILWIAFSIIFDLPSLGGKQLLARVVIVAFLINFSLVAVTATFGFTNALARVFSNNMPRTPPPENRLAVSDFIIQTLKLHNLEKPPSPEEKNRLRVQREQQLQAQQSNISGAGAAVPFNPADTSGQQIFQGPSTKDTFLAALGIQEAQAQLSAGKLIGSCLTSAIIGGPIGCVVGAVTVGLAEALLETSGGLTQNLYRNAVNQLTAAVFYTLAATAMLLGALTLLVRLISMIYLGVLAPLAFMIQTVPGNYFRNYWNMWVNALLKWAFFAPMFYFLFYLGLFMLDNFSRVYTAAIQNVNPIGSVETLIMLVIVCGFMIGAIKVARSTGDAISNVITSIAKTAGGFALGAATGGLGTAAGYAARRIPTVEKAIGRIGTLPFGIGRVTGPLAGRALGAVAAQRAEFQQFKNQFKDASEAQLNIASGSGPEAQRAAALTLLAEKHPKALQNRAGEALRLAKIFGAQGDILKLQPNLVTPGDVNPQDIQKRIESEHAAGRVVDAGEAARLVFLEKMTPADAAKISDTALEDKKVLDAMMRVYRPEHLQRMMRDGAPGLGNKLVDHINETITATPDRVENLRPEMYRFLASTAARGIGIGLAPGHRKPKAIIKEQIDDLEKEIASVDKRIQELNDRIDALRAAGVTAGIPRAQVDIDVQTKKKARLETELANLRTL